MRVKLLILTLLLLFFGAGSVFASVKINEFSSASNPEWVELYNTGNSNVNLDGWQILFHDNPSTPQKITLNSNDTISPGNFKIVERTYTGSGAWLSNNGDAIILKDSTSAEQDSIKYGGINASVVGAPTTAQTAGRDFDGVGDWVIFSTPTKGSTNNTSPSPSTPTPSTTPTPPTASSTTSSESSSFTIANIPSLINSDQSFNVSVDLTLPNNKNTDYYLSGAFKKVGNTRHFGLTKISSGWVKYDGNNYLNQYKITTNDGGNWTGVLEVKLDTADSDYKGSGDYIFKVARYSSSSNPTWSNEITIKITDVSNNNQGNVTIETPPPSITPTPYQSYSKNQVIGADKLKNDEKLVYRIASVAAAVANATPSAKVEIKNQKQTNPLFWAGVILIFAGVCLLGYIYLKRDGKIFNLFRRRN